MARDEFPSRDKVQAILARPDVLGRKGAHEVVLGHIATFRAKLVEQQRLDAHIAGMEDEDAVVLVEAQRALVANARRRAEAELNARRGARGAGSRTTRAGSHRSGGGRRGPVADRGRGDGQRAERSVERGACRRPAR